MMAGELPEVPFGHRESSNFDNSDNGSTGYSTSTGRDGAESTNGMIDPVLRQDNKMVKCVRGTVMLVLLSAAVMTSYFSFRLTRDSQIKAYNEAFDDVSSKLAPGLANDIALRVWWGSTLAVAVKTKIQDKGVEPHLLDFEAEDFVEMTEGARIHAGVSLIGWNPLLQTEEQRLEFEEMAVISVASSDALDPSEMEFPVCHICGSPTLTVASPDLFHDIPGAGPKHCGAVEDAGRRGAIPDAGCPILQIIMPDGCGGCVDKEVDPTELQEEEIIPRATHVSTIDEDSGFLVLQNGTAPYMPLWNIAGGGNTPGSPSMMDQMSLSRTRPAIDRMLEWNVPMFTEMVKHAGPFYEKYVGNEGEVSTTLLYPVTINNTIVGSVSLAMRWENMITSVIPEMSEFVHVVIENTLGQNYTFGVDPKNELIFLEGEGDLHEPAFDSKVLSTTYDEFGIVTFMSAHHPFIAQNGTEGVYCGYRFHVFAKQDFKDVYVNSDPIIYAVITASIFAFTSIVFIFYDCLVRRVQRKMADSAMHTTAIVSSLFPKNVRDRLLQQAADQSKQNNSTDAPMRMSKMRMQSFLAGGGDEDNATSAFSTEPIADLFASATVMFLDICSFTAWSSEREPSQVFILLETIYHKFDQIAGKLKVFKVETIGDSYVAVCGLPTRRAGHAPIMAKFARQCMAAMQVVTKNLEVRLGPSTGDLKARVGLHSGPVTAGVMRGEKARFQLFGDTVNTASRLESSGKPDRIHLSQACVDLLEKAGKGHWTIKRDKLVAMKGKGELQTYFLKDEVEKAPRHPMSPMPRISLKTVSGGRLIEWNTEVLYDFLKRIVVHRQKRGLPKHLKGAEETVSSQNGKKLVIDELTETLCLPSVARNTSGSTDDVKIPSTVKRQLKAYVKRIAETYRDVPFHNFEHCSHVLMSTSKLMKRIVNPDDIDYKQTDDLVAIAMHRTTYGITSDPILQFASLFAALIHDVDHTGLTNAELIDEKTPLAARYRNQSVAEQHSVDLAWRMLMEPSFSELRRCIYSSEDELAHFRQLVVNAVMATDIADKQLKQAREKRWAETFPPNDDPTSPVRESAPLDDRGNESQWDRDRKATIVFEYIIQASDVCHTMQHWHTYQKFNKRLFEERYVAWLSGSLKKEPSQGWYGGELWFFDNYIIPMASKLDKCGVFGVSYHEYLTYAKENRTEWERKGKEIVDKMKSHCDRKYAAQQGINNVAEGREA